MKLKKRKIKYAAIFCLCWFVFLVILVDGVLKFQTLVDYSGSYTLVEITLLLLVIMPTMVVYKLTKECKTMCKRELNEQREQSQTRLNSAESRVKKSKAQYIQANKDWLEAKSKEEGVKALPKGIYYKVLAEGDASSAHPTVRSIITAHYTGKTIDGKQFDSSRGGVPLACRLCDLIEGWIIAMQQMHIGDKWELYIPAEMGYGKFSQPGIPGGSTLIFEIELLGIA